VTVRGNLQSGVAAIEFAFVLMTLVLVLYGIATFGLVLYAQQVVSRAAEDGARAAPFQPKLLVPAEQAAAIEDIRGVVRNSLATSLIVPAAHSATAATRLAWITDQVTVSIVPTNPTVTVTVTFPYSENQLLPSLSAPWVPANLTSHAVAALSS
jgi:Flp pilus assembly protein TadG